MAVVEYCSHQKTMVMAIAPATRSAARIAASDFNQTAVGFLVLVSTIGASLISSIPYRKNAGRNKTKQLIFEVLECATWWRIEKGRPVAHSRIFLNAII